MQLLGLAFPEHSIMAGATIKYVGNILILYGKGGYLDRPQKVLQ